MKKVLKRFADMDMRAYRLIRAGLEIIIVCFLIYIYYIISSQSFLEYSKLTNVLPSLVMSVLIVFGGGFAFDSLLKDKK